jgi:hypothetical protein
VRVLTFECQCSGAITLAPPVMITLENVVDTFSSCLVPYAQDADEQETPHAGELFSI